MWDVPIFGRFRSARFADSLAGRYWVDKVMIPNSTLVDWIRTRPLDNPTFRTDRHHTGQEGGQGNLRWDRYTKEKGWIVLGTFRPAGHGRYMHFTAGDYLIRFMPDTVLVKGKEEGEELYQELCRMTDHW